MIYGQTHIVYFIGIGGIGMSALARWFHLNGKQVYGYDRTETPLTRQLSREGIGIHYRDDPALIPAPVLDRLEETLVVYTPAIPGDHRELNFLKQKGADIRKRSEVLGAITGDHYTVAVAGTHGKTTTSSMLAHMLVVGGKNPVAFLGGIVQEYDSNLIVTPGSGAGSVAVVEADEYDRSFLKLHPDVAIITSADADHLDIYGKREHLLESMRAFIGLIDYRGLLIVKENFEEELAVDRGIRHLTYGLDSGDCHAENIRIEKGSFCFDFHGPDQEIRDLSLNVPGYHNVENAVAAVAAGLNLGLDHLDVAGALSGYKGVKRRFEYLIREPGRIYIDDYAHHPEEIRALLTSVKSLYPEKKITVVFQPHLFSRTRDFADGFASQLDLADEVILLNIYPAREQPVEGVTSRMIMDRMKKARVKLCDDEQLLDCIKKLNPEVLLTVGAGDIDRFVQLIAEMLKKKHHYA